MDRLYAVAVAALLLTGCESKPKADAPKPQGRVNAVQAKAVKAQAPQDFCDFYAAPDAKEASPLVYPELSGDEPPTATGGWTWVNVWATWCKPCVEEMPRLAQWEDEIDGLADVVFLSADDDDEVVDEFLSKHPEASNDARMQAPDAMGPWLAELGYDGPSSLPVHVFADGSRRVRCIRVGGVSERDGSAVRRLVSSP